MEAHMLKKEGSMNKIVVILFSVIAVVSFSYLFLSCDNSGGGDNGDGVEYTVTIRAVSNGNPVAGAVLTIDSSVVGTTDQNGEITVTFQEENVTTVSFTKKFFVLSSASVDPQNDSTVIVEMNPQIFIPDFGNTRIVRVDDMTGANRNEITSVPSIPSYSLVGPMWVEVDYNNGFIYILDATNKISTDAHIIRIDDFPPTASGTEVVHLFNESWDVAPSSNLDYVRGPTQLALKPNGNILIADMSNRRLVEMSGIDDPNKGTVGQVNIMVTQDTQGVAILPNGKILRVQGRAVTDGPQLKTMDDINESSIDDFTGSTINYGPGTDQFYLPLRALVDQVGGYVYISDTGLPGTITPYANHRIARYTLDGTSRTNYGSVGSAKGQFINPVLMAILPDRRLYVMDVGNDRLVRIDSFENAAATWMEYQPAGADTFNLFYWYNFS